MPKQGRETDTDDDTIGWQILNREPALDTLGQSTEQGLASTSATNGSDYDTGASATSSIDTITTTIPTAAIQQSADGAEAAEANEANTAETARGGGGGEEVRDSEGAGGGGGEGKDSERNQQGSEEELSAGAVERRRAHNGGGESSVGDGAFGSIPRREDGQEGSEKKPLGKQEEEGEGTARPQVGGNTTMPQRGNGSDDDGQVSSRRIEVEIPPSHIEDVPQQVVDDNVSPSGAAQRISSFSQSPGQYNHHQQQDLPARHLLRSQWQPKGHRADYYGSPSRQDHDANAGMAPCAHPSATSQSTARQRQRKEGLGGGNRDEGPWQRARSACVRAFRTVFSFD